MYSFPIHFHLFSLKKILGMDAEKRSSFFFRNCVLAIYYKTAYVIIYKGFLERKDSQGTQDLSDQDEERYG